MKKIRVQYQIEDWFGTKEDENFVTNDIDGTLEEIESLKASGFKVNGLCLSYV